VYNQPYNNSKCYIVTYLMLVIAKIQSRSVVKIMADKAYDKILSNQSSCSERISITIDLPKDCRLDADILREHVSQIFVEGLLKNLCSGCPLEKPLHS